MAAIRPGQDEIIPPPGGLLDNWIVQQNYSWLYKFTLYYYTDKCYKKTSFMYSGTVLYNTSEKKNINAYRNS
jgi:hypothetical protein